MLDFPKQYKQTKINSLQQQNKNNNYFFFLPELYKDSFDVQQIFRLFLLDTLHIIYYGESLSGGYFLPDPLFHDKKDNQKEISFLKKQLKQFGLNSFVSGLKTHKDLVFKFNIQQFFANHFRKGTFFEDRFLVYRSPKHQTPISGDLVNYIATKKNRYTIKYFVSTKNHSLDIMTDAPETIFGDVAIAIHPQHKKAKQLKGQQAIIPIINKTIPIIIDERADFTRYGGIYRITPGHDKLGLTIAKDHNLPIDTYAIDKDGFFTDNAGLFSKKPVEDFFTNIIQSLSDIGNLTNTESFSGEIPVCQTNGEHLIFRSWKGIFVKTPEDKVSSFFDQEKIKKTGVSRDIIDSSYRLASSHQKLGIPLPLWKNESGVFVTDSERLQDAYNRLGEKQGLALGLFILHCISTNLISTKFSVEDFVTMIFDIDQEFLIDLFSLIETKYPQTKKEFDLFTKTIQNLDKEKSLEKNIDQILELLDNSFCLGKAAHGRYFFDFEKFDPEMKNVEHYGQVVGSDILSALLLLDKSEKNGINNPISFFTTQNLLKTSIKNILFAEYLLGKDFVESIYTLPSLKNKKESNDFPIAGMELTKAYHPDCLRIGFLSLSGNENTYDPDVFSKRDQSISKFWNACRYIKTTFFQGLKPTEFKRIQKDLEKDIPKFSTFDSRILSKLTVIVEEQQQIREPNQIGAAIGHLFDFIDQDFSGKYLELIKSAPSEYSNNISLCVVKTIASLLRPYLPILTNELSEIFGFKEDLNENMFLEAFKTIQKNYSISLFMEIIDKFSSIKESLGLKKHDVVGMFIRSNPDFIKFAKSNESLLKKTLNAEEVLYLVHHENIPDGYKEEDIIDISVGLKAIYKPKVSGIVLLQKQLQEKEEYLQHIKHIVQELNSNSADIATIQAKKDEINKIKKDIEELIFEISKYKMRD